MLYPRESETREVKEIGGLWKFKVDFKNQGREDEWFKTRLKDPIEMAVPASYNDIFQDPAVRDHVGDVWYEKEIFVHHRLKDERIILRIGSADHYGALWVNGVFMTDHQGGYMPFESDIGSVVKFGQPNRITLCVNNELSFSTIPPGEIRTEGGKRIQYCYHDFFNYCGLHRPVKLYTSPRDYIRDISVVTDIQGSTGFVTYSIEAVGKSRVKVDLIDRTDSIMASTEGESGVLKVENAQLWGT